MNRVARGALTVFYIGTLAAGLGMVSSYFWGHSRGTEAAEDKAAIERAELTTKHRDTVDKLRSDAQTKFDAALAEAAERYERREDAIRKAQNDLAAEQALTRRLRGERDAALARATERVRSDALAAAATGGTTEATDSVASCRARTDAFRRALEEVLPDYRACSLDLEDASGSTRALLRAADAEVNPQPAP